MGIRPPWRPSQPKPKCAYCGRHVDSDKTRANCESCGAGLWVFTFEPMPCRQKPMPSRLVER